MADTPAEKAEKAAIRRRWITLGEAVGVIAVLISGATLWNSWSERRHTEAERAQAAAKADATLATLVLRATPKDEGAVLALAAGRGEQQIQGQTVSFPQGLGVVSTETAGDPRIEAAWFDDALKKARRAAGRDEDKGDARLPVAILTRFTTPGGLYERTQLYDIGYTVEAGGLFGGAKVKLRGLSLIGDVDAGAAAPRLAALWKTRIAKK